MNSNDRKSKRDTSTERSPTALTALSIVVIVAVVGLLLLGAEGVVRLRQHLKYGDLHSLFYVDEQLGLRLPKASFETKSININSMSFRGPEIENPKPKGVVRIGFLGASTTFSSEASSNDAVWPHVLMQGISAQYPNVKFDYVNGGVPGYTTQSSLVNLQQRLLPLDPDVLIVYHATNDLSGDVRRMAQFMGITRVNLQQESSWLSEYSVLWNLLEKNLAIHSNQTAVSAQQSHAGFVMDEDALGTEFRAGLTEIVRTSFESGVKLVALVTFSTHIREGQTGAALDAATVTARYYMPHLSNSQFLIAFEKYNEIIREVARSSGAVLIEGEDTIPGDIVHFVDSVHFTDKGNEMQAARVLSGMLNSSKFRELVR